MGLGIGINCKICGKQLTVLDGINSEKEEACEKCFNRVVSVSNIIIEILKESQ